MERIPGAEKNAIRQYRRRPSESFRRLIGASIVDRKQIEHYVFYGILILSAFLFILLPKHPVSSLDFYLNRLVDDSIFANGYYQPSNYPFAAKVTNAFSVPIAIVSGIFMGIWRRNDIVSALPKNTWLILLIIIALGYHQIEISIYPQEYGRGRLTNEKFYNTSFFFLFVMLCKTVCIYIAFRMPITLVLYTLKIGRKPE